MPTNSGFRAKKRVGQIYINIPGSRTFWEEANADVPSIFNEALGKVLKEWERLSNEVDLSARKLTRERKNG